MKAILECSECNKQKCKSVFGFLLGHKFINVFDEKIEYQSLNDSSQTTYASVVLNRAQPVSKSESIYVKSICLRCGKEIKRNEEK